MIHSIKLIAQTLSSVVARKNDFVARYGGEEFAILMTTSEQSSIELLAQHCLKRIRDLAIPHQFSATAEHVTISIGIATINVLPKAHPATLIKQADSALYQSKENGRDQYTFSSKLSMLT